MILKSIWKSKYREQLRKFEKNKGIMGKERNFRPPDFTIIR